MWSAVLLLLSTATAGDRLRSPQRELARIERALSRADPGAIPELLLRRSGHLIRAGDAGAAAATCRQILLEYPGYARADLVRFTLASTLSELGEAEAAREILEDLIRLHPDSDLAGDAWALLGAHHFADSQLFRALSAYQHAVAHPGAERWLEANYMLAWCHYNLGDFATARHYLEAVLTSEADASLRAVALDEAVLFLVDLEDLDSFAAFYARHGAGERIPEAFGMLGDALQDRGEVARAREAYRRALAEAPLSSGALQWQISIVRGEWSRAEAEAMLGSVLLLREAYGPGSPWAALHGEHPEVEQELLGAARRLHLRARQRNATPYYAMSAVVYDAWIEAFPDSARAHEVRYAYGELLYRLKKHDEAFAQYQLAVDLDPDGPHARFCSMSSIYAAEEMARRAGDGEGLSQWESRMLEAIGRHLRLWPEDAEALRLAYRQAHLLHEAGMLAESEAACRAIIAEHPDTREAGQAALLLLESIVRSEDWARAAAESWALYVLPELGGPDLKRELFEHHERASFRQIAAASLPPSEAAAAFLDFTARFPDSRLAPLALSSAGESAERAGDLRLAESCYVRLVQGFPASEQAAGALASAGRLAQAQGRLDEAIAYYTRFLTDWPGDDRAEAIREQLQRAQEARSAQP